MEETKKAQKPTTIWHYTNWAGLDGILRSGKLWASHISYLNDTAEVTQAAKIFKQQINERVKNALILNWDADMQPALDQLEELNVCVTSFSTNGDDLSQWRGYASPPPGFAVGFDLEAVGRIAAREKSKLVKCEYDRFAQRKNLRAIVEGFLAKVSLQANDANRDRRLKHLKWELLQSFAAIAPEFKNPRFAAEEEWRLITESTEWLREMDFHASKSLVVPHYGFPIRNTKSGETALRFVRIGPNAHMKLAHKSIEMLLKARGYEGAVVYRSKVPFRNW